MKIPTLAETVPSTRPPNFLIVGATKAGTTTLQRHLAGHPDIFMCPDDLHFFSLDERYRRGDAWYLKHFPAGAHEAVGEKSPSYSWEPSSACRIHRFDSEMKLVWILRDPVARSYSHYWQMVRAGNESLRFEECLTRERHCIVRSIYADQIQRFLEHFDLARMCFILFEELRRDPASALSAVHEFLGVERRAPVEASLHARKGLRYPRHPWVNRVFSDLLPRTRTFERARSSLHRTLSDPEQPPMGTETESRLRAFFEPHNERLRGLTGLDLSSWWGKG